MPKKQEETTQKEANPFKLASLIMLIIIIWLCTLIGGYASFDNWAERGQFGDLFGSINALFSGLALAGIIYTIYLQKAELANQVKVQKDALKVAISQVEVEAQKSYIEFWKEEKNMFILYESKERIRNENDVSERCIRKMRESADNISNIAEQLKNTINQQKDLA
jgi:hypothetical protein